MTVTMRKLAKWVSVRKASSRAMPMQQAWHQKRVFRRSQRSISAPEKGENRKIGIDAAKSMIPRAPFDPVSLKTSQPMATRCIQSPEREIDWAVKKSL